MSRRGKRGRGRIDGWEEWQGGYMGAKIQKLQEQYQKDSTETGEATRQGIFQGVAIHVNGYTKPSWSELKRLMLAHGGVYHHYYRSSLVTHIIATNLPDSKLRQITDQRVVHPSWITDSVDACKLLPYQSYVVGTRKGQSHTGIVKALSFGKAAISSPAAENRDISATDASAENHDISATDASAENCDISATDASAENRHISATDASAENRHISVVYEPRSNKTESQEVDIGPLNGADLGGDLDIDGHLADEVNDSHRLSLGATIKVPPASSSSSKKAGDPNFVSEFYSNSRLHHLSTWGAEWRAYVNKLQGQTTSFPAREHLRSLAAGDKSLRCDEIVTGKPLRVIMHIDMDSFFVSVGLRKRPDLRGKPIAVTHSKGSNAKDRPGTDIDYEMSHWQRRRNKLSKMRKGTIPADDSKLEDEGFLEGQEEQVAPSVEVLPNSMAEIASCSYEARKAGVKNGMFFGRARQLCPDLIPIPYDFEGYREVSQILYDTVARYTHDIEAVSCDEMLVDCTDLLADTGLSSHALAKALRDEVGQKTHCTCSVGMGPNILIARMATRVAKPDGQTWVDESDMAGFMRDKPVRDLPGVGWAISKKLNCLGVETCAEMEKLGLSVLQTELGPKTGKSLYNFCRGVDERQIKVERERKSVSADINYGIRFTKDSDVEGFMGALSEEVQSRLAKINMKCKTITVKVKVRKAGAPQETLKFMGHGICDNVAKSSTLPVATDCVRVIKKECLKIVKLLKIPAADYRGIGIQLGRLELMRIGTQAKSASTPSILNYTASARRFPEKTATAPDKSPSLMTGVSTTTPDKSPSLMTGVSITTPDKSPSLMTGVSITTPDKSPSLMTGASTTTPDRHCPSFPENESVTNLRLPDPPPLPSLATFVSPNSSQSIPGSPHVYPSTSAAVTTDRPSAVMTENGLLLADERLLPGASQLDLSCIQALPPDLQEELGTIYGTPLKTKLLQHHSKKQEAQDDPPRQIHPLMLLQPKGSPVSSPSKNQARKKKTSPRKSPSSKKSRSPNKAAFKVPVGRPLGQSKLSQNPRKLDFGQQRPQINNNCVVIPTAVEEEKTAALEIDSLTTPDPVSLGGAVSLEEVKLALLSWIQSTDSPCGQDEVLVVDYLAALAQHRDLERVFLLLRFLIRKIHGLREASDWMRCYQSMVEQTQAFVRSLYGGRLKL